MTRRAPLHRGASTLLLAAVALLPSCATCALWGVDWPEHFSSSRREGNGTTLHEVGEQVNEQDVAVSRCELQGQSQLALVGAADEPAWRLRPVANADVALQLLGRTTLFTPATAAIAAERELHDEDVAKADASLELRGSFRREVVGVVIDPAGLDESVRAVLAQPRFNAVAYASDPTLYLPRWLRTCVRRAGAQEVASLLASERLVRVESFVFVGPDGQPCYEAGMPVPPELDDAELPLPRALALLEPLDLVLRIAGSGDDRYVRLDAEAWWLWSACEHAGDVSRHGSRWQLERCDRAAVGALGSEPLAGHLTRRDVRYQRFVYTESAATWQRVLSTPLTVLLDATVLLPFNLLAVWLEDDDDDWEPPREPAR